MNFLFRIFPFTQSDWRDLPLRPVMISIVVSLCLIGIRYYSASHHFADLRWLWELVGMETWADKVEFALNHHPDSSLWDLVYWSIVTTLFFLVVPLGIIIFGFRQSPAEFGLKIKGIFFGWKAYAFMAAVMFPVVIVVSFSPEFVHTYPFYRFQQPEKLFPQFFIWEFFYILQFFSLEFFFRGFMVLGLKPWLKGYSILAMTIPYCMIHFSKPLPECIGSIFAGLVLGAMSYRTGSIWLGAAIHVFVALSMDLLSLWHRGIL